MCVRGGWLTNKEWRKRGEQGGVAVDSECSAGVYVVS